MLFHADGSALRELPSGPSSLESPRVTPLVARAKPATGLAAALLRPVPSQFSWDPLQVREKDEMLRSTRKAVICAMNHMLDLKDLNTGVHGTRLAEWAVRIGQEMGIEDSCLEDIEVAALLHDAGKVGVPDAILRKAGPLDPAEWSVMKMHPEYSWAVLRLVPGLERASLFALHHHEKFDGSGYPGGLRGDEIPIGARIVSVIDAFDAMVAERPYKRGLPCEEALRRLIVDSGRHFDPEVVHHFIGIASAEMTEVFDATGVDASIAL